MPDHIELIRAYDLNTLQLILIEIKKCKTRSIFLTNNKNFMTLRHYIIDS